MFIILLLDYKLYSDIYNSIVVGFLIAIGIWPGNIKTASSAVQILYDAADFIPKLSALIKIG